MVNSDFKKPHECNNVIFSFERQEVLALVFAGLSKTSVENLERKIVKKVPARKRKYINDTIECGSCGEIIPLCEIAHSLRCSALPTTPIRVRKNAVLSSPLFRRVRKRIKLIGTGREFDPF